MSEPAAEEAAGVAAVDERRQRQAADLAVGVAEAYDLGAPDEVSVTFFRGGFNDHFRVGSPRGELHLRLYLEGKYYISGPDDFRWELGLVDHLAHHDVPVARPVPTREGPGSFLGSVDVEGAPRHVALLELAPGAPPTAEDGRLVPTLGDIVARLHVAADDYETLHPRYAFDLRYLLDEPLDHMHAAFREAGLPPIADDDLAVLEEMRGVVERLGRESPMFGPIHGDLHFGNLHVDGDAICLFDFDHGGYGWRAYDLATVFGGLDDAGWQLFLDAYAAVREPSPTELDTVPVLSALRPLWDIGDVLAMQPAWGISDFGPKYAPELHDRVERAVQQFRAKG